MHEDLASPGDPRPHRIAVLALPAVVALDLTIATHTFAHDGHGQYRVDLCAVTAGPVRTTTGYEIGVQRDLGLLDEVDTVIVPGFDRGPTPKLVLDALRRFHVRGGRLASICTGAFALARAGVLDGRRATTHWAHAAQLAREHPRVEVDPGALYLDEGDVLTSAGVTAGLDLCLYLVGRDFGPEAAIERARQMVAPLHRAGSQAQFVPVGPDGASGTAPVLAEVTTWALDHLGQPITLETLAGRARQAPRTFSRSFSAALGVSPMEWVTQQRLRLACRLLEAPALTIDAVAARSGLGSAANLRLHFRRAYDTTPTVYRAAFAPRPVERRPLDPVPTRGRAGSSGRRLSP